jgi:hypothetical protein
MAQRLNLWLALAVAALLGVIVGMLVSGGREVAAQGDGTAGHIVALTGDVSANHQPIYIVDTREQALLVYEYGLGRSGLYLVAARNFQYDKLLKEFDVRENQGRSPLVEDVRKGVGSKKGR